MIACDTNIIVAYLQGGGGADIDLADRALASGELALPPVVLTEILSDPGAPPALRALLADCETLSPVPGYWERAGFLRAKLFKQKLKAATADALIAQSCIDYNVPLITRDADFRHFAKFGGLRLA